MAKSSLVVCETETAYSEETKRALVEAGMKPVKTVAWLFLVGRREADRKEHAVMRVHSPKHARKIYEALTLGALAGKESGPTGEMYIGATGRWVSQAVLGVIDSMNIPKDEVKVVRVSGKRR